MRHLRFIRIRSVLAGAAAAGLTCGLTATAAYGAASSRAAMPSVLPTTVTWHKIALQNGWKSAATTSYTVANPSYAVYGGVVYLDGSLSQTVGTNTEFGVLPLGFRPAHTLYLTVFSGAEAGTPGTVKITPKGVMTASSPTGSTRMVTSLEAVSFPAAGASWTNISLHNGWQSGSAAFSTGSPAYTVRSGIAYLSGSLLTNGDSNLLVTTLPTTARPLSIMYIAVYDHGGLAGYVQISPSGSVYARGVAAATQTALDGVSYPTSAAALSWHKFTLATGWSSSQSAWGTGDPQYAVHGPIVYLAGSMNFNTSSGGSAVFASVPAAARSIHLLVRQVYTWSGSTGVVVITPSLGVASSGPPSNSRQFTSLAGIAYPRNS